MRIRNLTYLYVYSADKKLVSGEWITTWYYKDKLMLNKQQDLDELNRNSAGVIDYEILKLRFDQELDIKKGDGISLNPLEIDKNKKVIDGKPDYLVENKPTIGKTTLYTLVTNNGD